MESRKNKYRECIENHNMDDLDDMPAQKGSNRVIFLFDNHSATVTCAYVSETTKNGDKIIEFLRRHNPDVQIRWSV